MVLDIANLSASGIASDSRIKIYTGILGQIGDIIMFTPTARRIKQLFPNCTLTFAVASKYAEAGRLLEGLPYVDRLFITENYFEKLSDVNHLLWEHGWPVELRGEDEIHEQFRHDIVFETRPRMRRMPWWQYNHLVAERAYNLGIPGPMNLQTEIVIPEGTIIPRHWTNKFVFHNDPNISSQKAWSWDELIRLTQKLDPENCVIIGGRGPAVPGVLDLRQETTLAQAAAIIQQCKCYIGIDSGLLWIASSLKVPVVAMFGTTYVPSFDAGYPTNPHANYIQSEREVTRIRAEDVYRSISKMTTGGDDGLSTAT